MYAILPSIPMKKVQREGSGLTLPTTP